MAREIYVPLGDTGNANLYFRRRNAAGQYWRGDTSAYETFNAANLSLYGADAGSATPYNALIEDGSTGDYFGNDPASGTGTWTAYEQAGAAPAASDDAVATGDFPQAAAEAAIAAAGIATEDKQDEILAAIASAGVGARTCVITVDDGSTALESARVRVTKGAESWLQTTDASGEATFNLDDGSWTVAITLAGYTFGGDTLVVNGDETETYSMTAAGFTSSVEPDSVTVRWRVMDEDGRPCGAGEGTVRIRVSVGPKVAGFAWDKSERLATTDANGYVEFPDVPIGCTLRAKLGAASAGGEWTDVAIPSDATSPYEPVEILGTVP